MARADCAGASPSSSAKTLEADYVIVGGGIAGVSCAETLAQRRRESANEKVLLVSASGAVKRVTNLSRLTERLAAFDVEEVDADQLGDGGGVISVVKGEVKQVFSSEKCVVTKSGRKIRYKKKLCLCQGAGPKVVFPEHPLVRGIRDTESVRGLQRALEGARRVLVVGNGGIATEFVHEVRGVEVVWAVRDDSVAAAFVDAGAGEFFMDVVKGGGKGDEDEEETKPSKRSKYRIDDREEASASSGGVGGSALGPDWHSGLNVGGAIGADKSVRVEFECELGAVHDCRGDVADKVEDDGREWKVYAELTNGKVVGCDLIVSATGVVPNGRAVNVADDDLELTADGAVKVDWRLRTSVKDVHAAGDVCEVDWGAHFSPLWFQMRLWTQARQMGMYAAQCMAGTTASDDSPDFCFEMFTHATRFFGYKVVLLGLFNGQTLDNGAYEALVRVTRGKEYVKCVMVDGRMRGAVLVGDTDLEETFENLILNQIDLTDLGEDILNPDVDIEDYFD